MIGERIKRARAAAGLSQREAARRAELSAMAISKFERGETTPTSRTLIRLAHALGTRTEFFLRPDTVELGDLAYRRPSSLGKRARAQLEADILEQVERLLEVVSLFPVPPVPSFALPDTLPERCATVEDVEAAASAVRNAWTLGHQAIWSLSETLTRHGLLVLTTSVGGADTFDGLSATVGGRPLIVVGRGWPGDRQRLALAHALGRLALDGRVCGDLDEDQARERFARAFLLPRQAVVTELGAHRRRIEAREIDSLERSYGVSALTWIQRGRDVGVLTASGAKKVLRTFADRGRSGSGPGGFVPPEVPQITDRLVLRAFAQEMITLSKAAELMRMSVSALRRHLLFEEQP